MADSCCKGDRCVKCGRTIIKERRAALPQTEVCVGCSASKAYTVLDIEIDEPDKVELINSMTNQEH